MLSLCRWRRRHSVSIFRNYRTDGYIYGNRHLKSAGCEDAEMLTNILKKERNIQTFVDYFRVNGHRLCANVNPLIAADSNGKDVIHKLRQLDIPMENETLRDIVYSPSLQNASSFSNLIDGLAEAYCSSISAEFQHCLSAKERAWFAEQLENLRDLYPVSPSEKTHVAALMLKGQHLDKFLASKFSTVKRYSGEGTESLLVCVDAILHQCSASHVHTVVIGMPHRGRNNVLTTLLNYPVNLYFRKMKGLSEFAPDTLASGDTFSHYFISSRLDHWPQHGSPVHVTMVPNPSHLEANIPVAMGKARSKMQTLADGDYNERDPAASNGEKVLCLLIHGDASVTGQGVVAESLAIGHCPHFDTGGSVHVIVNNQVGFTTESARGSSFQTVSDVSKTIAAPVLHVNADEPEAVLRATRLAVAYRQLFRKDVFIDLIGYRRWGHNELDDPTMTQPVMYAQIKARPTAPDAYLDRLRSDPDITDQMINVLQTELNAWDAHLNENLDCSAPPEANLTFHGSWRGFDPVSSGATEGLHVFNTGLPLEELRQIGQASVTLPEDFQCHPTVQRSVVTKRPKLLGDSPNDEHYVDWATAEALSVGSLLKAGHPVRISGQDVGRGTFSHRHFMLVDQATDAIWIPFNSAAHQWPARLEVVNSPLSEAAVLGFELGMAADRPDRLVIWETQFGDFFNSAQVQLDTYIGSSEAKWYQSNGIVITLPHGYDGAGPEHSSCRLERWLQMTDSIEMPIAEALDTTSTGRPATHRRVMCDTDAVNLHVVAPTTPAQYFHLLRRQILRPYRRPLVVVGPKTMLRLPAARSSLDDLREGTSFRHLITDCSGDPAKVEHVILCTGKHFYALQEHVEQTMDAAKRARLAFVRVEQLAPFPTVELGRELRRFAAAKRFTWSQEEPRNMGAWGFVSRRVENFLGLQLGYAGRVELACPAVGIGELHRAEIARIFKQTFDE